MLPLFAGVYGRWVTGYERLGPYSPYSPCSPSIELLYIDIFKLLIANYLDICYDITEIIIWYCKNTVMLLLGYWYMVILVISGFRWVHQRSLYVVLWRSLGRDEHRRIAMEMHKIVEVYLMRNATREYILSCGVSVSPTFEF